MNDEDITIKDLYPDFSDEEREEADRQLREYARVVWMVAEQLEQDPEKMKEFKRLKKKRRRKRGTDLNK